MKSAFTLPGLMAGTVFLILASGCATSDTGTSAPETYRSNPPIGSHIVRRAPAPTPTEQEREKAGERSGQAAGTPAQTKL